jgi:hypothetical protein
MLARRVFGCVKLCVHVFECVMSRVHVFDGVCVRVLRVLCCATETAAHRKKPAASVRKTAQAKLRYDVISVTVCAVTVQGCVCVCVYVRVWDQQ